MTSWLTNRRRNWLLATALNRTAGAVEVIGFLTLGGLFTAHITGTQLTVDLATLFRRREDPDELARARRRASVIIPCIVGFVVGCAAGASLEVRFGLWALALPAVLAVLAIALSEPKNRGLTTHRDSNDAKLPTD